MTSQEVRRRRAKVVCAQCNSEDIRCSAEVVWDYDNQQWDVVVTYDDAECQSCGYHRWYMFTPEVTDD